MHPGGKSFFDHALAYLGGEFGPPHAQPSDASGPRPGQAHWALPAHGPRAGQVRLELEAQGGGEGVRLTMVDPTAVPPHRVQSHTAQTPAQLEVALAAVRDQLSA